MHCAYVLPLQRRPTCLPADLLPAAPGRRALLPRLQGIFKCDRVTHGWMAVSRYDEIEEDFKRYYTEGESALRTTILINCGAAEDVRALLHLDQRENVRVVIIDSHRCAPGACGWAAGMEGGLARGELPPRPAHACTALVAACCCCCCLGIAWQA